MQGRKLIKLHPNAVSEKERNSAPVFEIDVLACGAEAEQSMCFVKGAWKFRKDATV